MRKYNTEEIDILNYLAIKKHGTPILRNYKIIIKDIGCNAQCPMCNDWKLNGDKEKIRVNLYKSFLYILKENIKIKHVQILGGEPIILFNDIVKIITLGKKYNITFDFPTNGSLLNYQKIDILLSIGLKNFTFSLDFASPKHDVWRTLPGVFQKICNFTQYIQKKGGKVQWNTVVGNFNLNDVKLFKNLYNKYQPNTHSFICIEKHSEDSKFMLDDNEKKYFLEFVEKYLQNDKINIIANGFENENNTKLEPQNLCYVPLKIKSFYISEESVINNGCYYRGVIKDYNSFTIQAMTKGCSKCNSAYKYNYNNYMDDLIKQYKLISK